MPSNDLLQRALDEAFVQHFAKLFSVLMADPGDAALVRFERGLTFAVQMYDEVEGIILGGRDHGWAS